MSLTAGRALIVGGTSGIGAGMAQALAARHYQVVVAGRSAERGRQVIASLDATTGGQHKFVAVDCFDLSSVRAAVEEVGEPVDVLVLCQGMATLQGYTPTEKDGLDEKLQLHYFSRIYASLLVCPHMQPGGRVLTVLSAGVHSKYKHCETDFELKDRYSIKNAADAAGFYTDAGFEALSQKFPNVTFCHAAPGFVATAWGTEMPAVLRTLVIRPLQKMFGKSARDCGETLTRGLLDLPPPSGDNDAQGGFYLMDEKGKIIDKAKGIKHTDAERDLIWEKTLALLPDV